MKTIQVERSNGKSFRINVPDEAKLTFAPWSPREIKYGSDNAVGTLRVYSSRSESSSILGVFSGVTGFRDVSLDYEEEVVREEGAVIWKSDRDGYKREEKVKREHEWVTAELPEAVATRVRRVRKA